MRKSAQDKWDKVLSEYRETQQAITEMVTDSRVCHGDYSYACGYLQSLTAELIGKLSKADREYYRAQLLRQAGNHRNEILLKTIKESNYA